MAKKNGRTIKIGITAIITIVLVMAGVLIGYGRNGERLDHTIVRVDKMEPEVKLNTEARKENQTDIKWIKGSLERIEKKL